MGIRPYKAFTFDGESSLDYGVYLTGEGVFNAPERAVEMVEIPGRNGNFVLDKGRFQNISVTYRAGMVDYSETDFATRVSDVRNWLCSRVGYCRLEDDYNPNEYRMAAFVSGIEVDHADLQTGEFEITFDCKPQRWLTSGETAVSVTSGDTITNPTLFDAEPLLAVEGYGTLGFNGYEIELENVLIGDVSLHNGGFTAKTKNITIDTASLNIGDTITINGTFTSDTLQTSGLTGVTNTNASFTTDTTTKETSFEVSFTCGTSQTVSNQQVWSYTGGATKQTLETIKYQVSSTANKLTFEFNTNYFQAATATWNISVIGDSTMLALGHPTYIDCDMGGCYMIKNDEIVSLNAYIDLGSDLPKLKPSANEITYDNTITDLKVTPRWWKV